MEFKFNVNDIFKQPIVEVNQNLIPPGFSGDRRALWTTVGKVSEIVNAMGEASAAAQGLSKPITTAERLRNSEHKLYFLVDQAANNGNGAVVGMLKTGKKGLYVFDRQGQHYQVSPPCVLDFYVHESRQRAGLGKQLYEHMLQREETEPVKMAIDRPSDKLLGFLNKHYTLNSPVKQMNNFVVFDDFFPKSDKNNVIEPDNSGATRRKESANGLQCASSPYGRYAAPRPPCSMGQIIHNQTSTINKGQEPTGVQSMPATNYQGMQYTSPNLHPNITQSTPNINYGEQILNNANQYQNPMMTNNTQYQNQLNQAYSSQGMNPNIMVNNNNQNQSPTSGYQVYHSSFKPTMNTIQKNVDNRISMPSNVQSVQNVPTQLLPQNHPNLINYNSQNAPNVGMAGTQNQMAAVSQQGNQGDVTQHQNYKQQPIQNIQQENQYQNQQEPQVAMTNQWLAPNVVYSQPTIPNQNYTTNEPYQQNIQNQSNTAPQTYTNPNQQFENTNINNQAYNQEIINRNAMNAHATYSAQPINAGIPNENQSMQQTPNMELSQTAIPNNYVMPQVHNAGDNLQSSVVNQNQWNQQNLQNAAQYQAYMNSKLDINANNVQNPQYISNTMVPSQTGIPPNYPAQTSMPMIPSQLQTPVAEKLVPQVGMTTQQNRMVNVEPHAQFNAANQQVVPNPNIQQDDVRKYASNPAVQISQAHNLPQSYIQSVPNIPQHQIAPTIYQQSYNATTAGQNPPIQMSQGLTNQTYNPPIQNMSNQQVASHINQPNLQNMPPSQISYSTSNFPNPAVSQMSKHNMPINTFSAPNMSQGDVIQRNVSVTNARGDERSNKNNEMGGVTNTKEPQEIRNDGKGDANSIEEEGNLLYGYPPQYVNNEQADGEKIDPSPKLERPRSLSIQPSEEQPEEKNSNDINSKTLEPPTNVINDVIPSKLKVEIEKDEDATKKLPTTEIEAVPAGKKTPSHLTEQGYLDLKFYHNKLW